MLIHCCRRCGFETRIFKEYEDHLFTPRHQIESRGTFLKWREVDDLKSLVVYAQASAPAPSPSVVVALFRKLASLVCDFVYWETTPHLFIVQLSNRKDVDEIMRMLAQEPEQLKIEGELVGLRRKSEVLSNEWPILIGNCNTEAGASREIPVIDIIDDSDSVNGSESDGSSVLSTRRPTRGSISSEISILSGDCNDFDSNNSKEMERMDENSVDEEPNGENPTPNQDQQQDEEEEEPLADVKISTQISDFFVKTFNSKVKQDASDDKEEMKRKLRWMEKKWTEIYVDFHNKFWPVLFSIRNSKSKMKCKQVKDAGFEAKFNCNCLRTDNNVWFRKRYQNSEEIDEVIKAKIPEFREVLQNDLECNRRMNQLSNARKVRQSISFRCEFTVPYYYTSKTQAQLTITNIEGKRAKEKMRLIEGIFTQTFKDYEKQKIKKWTPEMQEPTLETSSDEWTNIVFGCSLE